MKAYWKPIVFSLVLLSAPLMAQETHVVQPNQTLYSLARLYNVSVDQIRTWNNLGDNHIRVGQTLVVKPAPENKTLNPGLNPFLYTVRAGDSLSALSQKFDISLDDLRKLNGITNQALYAGERIYIRRPIGVTLYQVQPGDSLSSISVLFDISQDDLRGINQLPDGSLHPNQTIRVFKPSEVPLNHEVLAIDTLQGISALYGIPTDVLLKNNGLTSSDLKVGQVLRLRNFTAASTPAVFQNVPKTAEIPKAQTAVSFPEDPPTVTTKKNVELPDFKDADREKLHWDNYVVMDKNIPVFEWNNDYYYWTHPGELSQPNKGYYENNWPSPLDAYRKARILLEKFNSLIAKKPPLSKILEGYTVVLDPGHGGLDPGAIVKSSDGEGNDLYLTEHEYVYDIALRMYALLKRHGANVELTLLAPNHLIRDTQPANHTLINEKNQVYNDLVMNQSDDNSAWPEGSQRGLDKRIEVSDKDFRGVPVGKRIYISLHADNNPGSPLGTGVYALETRDGVVDDKSKAFADKLVPYLGKNAYSRTQNLAVLRGNDADYKVLVEVHNLASEDQAWAMRFGNFRQLDAQKLVRGLLEYFN